MPSRRRFLQTTTMGGTGLLAGCSLLGNGSSSVYPDAVPAPAAVNGTPMSHAARYDLATMRTHSDLFHPECGEWAVGCTYLTNDATAQGAFVLDLEDVATVVAGGAHQINAHPRTLVSLVGAHAFKLYEYTADSSTVEAALQERYTPTSSEGPFQYYRDEGATETTLADDGKRLIAGVEDVPRVVAERLEGDHESFASARPDVATARDHLTPTTAELVSTAPVPSDEDPDWHDARTVTGEAVELGDAGVEYRSAMVFESESTMSQVPDDGIRKWAADEFLPALADGVDAVREFTIERSGRTIVVSGSPEQYVGIF